MEKNSYSASTKSKLRLFFYRLFLFLLVVITFDKLCGLMLQFLYFKRNHGEEYKITYSLEKTKAQMLIIGSSKAQVQYIPNTFEDSLNMTCYNTGMEGLYIFYYDAVLKCVLKRYTPKVVVLDILPWELERQQSNYDRLSRLLPYYTEHPEIRDIIQKKSSYERIKLLSSIYPFNSTILQSLNGLFDFRMKNIEEAKSKGFSPYNYMYKEDIKKRYFTNLLDTVCINALKSFVFECKKSKIKLFIICSPVCQVFVNKSSSIEIAQDLANANNVTFMNFSQDPFFLSRKYLFADAVHLNEDGAKIYSNMLAEKLRISLTDSSNP